MQPAFSMLNQDVQPASEKKTRQLTGQKREEEPLLKTVFIGGSSLIGAPIKEASSCCCPLS
ncbi:MAG: hypothetical protein EB012_02230 [Gammaproteobacteria bacterium]|nr:hypothetical protein [Gammaproteobacteria bacterium]